MKVANFRSAYSQKLLDPRWQKLRLEIFERDNWTCRGCGEDSKTLHVHHTHYIQGFEPWEYEDESQFLVTLCCDCHEEETAALKAAKQSLFSAMSSLGIYLSIHLDAIAKSLNDVPPMTTDEVMVFAELIERILGDRLKTFIDQDDADNNLWVSANKTRKPF